jgi:predicted Zn-dependent peptidase
MNSLESIKVTRLDNGLLVATDQMTSVETVSIGVWVDAGTRHEKAHVNGISHLLEHMAFKGTDKRSAQDIAEQIEAVGGQINAYTSREHTAYYAKILKEDTKLATDIIADILQNSVLASEELEKEQTVVIQEIGQSLDTPDDIIFDYFQATAYPEQPLGRPVLGTVDLVRSMNRDIISNYMKDNYTVDRMILSAAGNIQHEDLVTLAQENFGHLISSSKPYTETAKYHGGHYKEHRELEQVHIVMGFEGVAYHHPSYHAASVLSTLLGGGMSSRLFQEIREKRGLVYSIYSFSSSYDDTGLFGIYAGTSPEDSEKIIPIICDELLKITQDITETELQRAKAQIKASLLMSLESSGARCEQLVRHLQIFGEPQSIKETIKKIEAIDRKAIIETAHFLFSTKPTLATIGPSDNNSLYTDILNFTTIVNH